MKKTKKPLVFICHSTKDKPFVRMLANRLNQDGVNVWVDHLEIKIGDSIHDKINEGLSKSDFLIVVLSKESVKSRWVREELNSASSLEKLSDKGVFILPVLIERCNVPPLLMDRRYSNFLDDENSAYQELLDGIFHHFSYKHPEVDVKPLEPPEIHLIYTTILDRLVFNYDILLSSPPRFFEEFVAVMFESLGFDTQVTPVTRDGGADIVASKPPAPGLSPVKTIIECKQYTPPKKVGVDVVRQLLGSLNSFGAAYGIIITTSYFTKDAELLAANSNIDLVDRDKLSEMFRAIDVNTWLALIHRRFNK